MPSLREPVELRSARQDQFLLWTAVAATALIHISIAASQLLLGIGVALMLVFRRKFQFPRIGLPLLVFFALTLISLLHSPDPWHGRPQIRKFYVFLLVPFLYQVFSTQFSKIRYVAAGWALTATASGVWGVAQFVQKYHHSQVTGEDFYTAYVAARITGFESHWMTFGALQLAVLLFLLAQLLFSNKLLPKWAYLSIAVLGSAICLGWTRSIWLGAVPSVLYLLWFWRPKMIWIVPVVIAIVVAISPGDMQERLTSFVNPHGGTDSNEHRLVTFETGWQMIKAHPILGLGPEQIPRQFDSYVPAWILRPLPVGYYGHLHNIYLQYAAERGVPAMCAMMWLIGTLLWDSLSTLRRMPRRRDEARFVLHAAVAITLAMLVEGLFEFNLGDSEVLMMFLSVIAVAYAARANAAATVTQ